MVAESLVERNVIIEPASKCPYFYRYDIQQESHIDMIRPPITHTHPEHAQTDRCSLSPQHHLRTIWAASKIE